MRLNRIYTLVLSLLLMAFTASAQGNGGNDVEMADALRSSGKIYVVVVSLLLILIGLVIFLFVTERKIKRLEDQIRNNR